MTEPTVTGGTLLAGIGLNMPELVRIPLSNMFPALPAARRSQPFSPDAVLSGVSPAPTGATTYETARHLSAP